MKKILVLGKNSYIGDSILNYFGEFPNLYEAECLDSIGLNITDDLFSGYDVVINVAGIAHIKETKDNKHLYYEVNRDFAVNTAKVAKKCGVKQYVLLSTMSVYGQTIGTINKDTTPSPKNAYGESKLEADIEIEKLVDNNFKFACLRPPMIYGKGCKGNYQQLRSFALKSPIFPDYQNKRSMLYIGNLCAFIKKVIDEELYGLFFPQNKEYVNTSEMVKLIAQNNKKNIKLVSLFNSLINKLNMDIINKVFGTLIYEKVDCVDEYSFADSIYLTEKG